MFEKAIRRNAALVALAILTVAFRPPELPPLPDLDKRSAQPAGAVKSTAIKAVRDVASDVTVQLNPVTDGAAHVTAKRGFLTGREGRGPLVSETAWKAIQKSDPHGPTKAFLHQHRLLFGHGPEALDAAAVQRDFVTSHNRLRTVTWQQRVDGIPVFEGVLTSHTTGKGELVSVASGFISEQARAALLGKANRLPRLTAAQAVQRAAENLGSPVALTDVALHEKPAGAEQKHVFHAARLTGETTAELVWLPMNKDELRLCWNIVLKPRSRAETFRVLIDAESGEVLLRRCLTAYVTNSTFRVFTSDSPSPFSPGHSAPLTNQPPLVTRSLVTFSALDTNASPGGWIDDGVNETRGNNVDAHRDTNDDDTPDLPRPQGSPFHVFDPPLDLTQSPALFGNASVVQLFYWCNWMHDKLYELGFTEAAGNFQVNNFGRGGTGNDAVLADAQDGGGFNNANMLTLPDGVSPRMQMYLFNGPNPDVDGSFDAEIVLHEYTHGLSNRRVGGGVGISALQSVGMGEGWSDFYALALLSEPGDDVNAAYAMGGYATHRFLGLLQNYYYGIRRYPYSTDLAKNPLTFKDIDPTQASAHPSVPVSPVTGGSADEVHNQGEVWCAALWEARANLIATHGWTNGNQLILQLVTDGMNLSPANPNFLQARDAIIQADLINNAGANYIDLSAAFAKRGMGASATSPSSTTTIGVQEAFDLPDDLNVTPNEGFTSSGPVGGPFSITTKEFTLRNTGSNALTWTAINSTNWLNASLASGPLATGEIASVTVSLTAAANALPTGIYSGAVRFTNVTSGVGQARTFTLRVGQPDFFTEVFENSLDLQNVSFMFTPDDSPSFYSVCRESVTNFFSDPAGGVVLSLTDDSFSTRTIVATNVSLYGRRTNVLHVGSNGYITYDAGDTDYTESASDHFALPRVTALFRDLNPVQGGTVRWLELSNRVAVTWDRVTEYGRGNSNSFQIEMFFDGRIRITYLHLDASSGLAGLSQGLGLPFSFDESDFSGYHPCGGLLTLPSIAALTEGNGTVVNAGAVALPFAVANNVTITLVSSDPSVLTVPPDVIVPAGETNAFFDITPTDDAALDGTQSALITASAVGFTPAARAVVVHDNESATLSLGTLATVNEGAGSFSATLFVSAPVSTNVVVSLTSSDSTQITVPSFVTIPAGQTSVLFNISVVEELEIDGTQTVTVSASVTNWIAGSVEISVEDNESHHLDMFLYTSQALESAGVLIDYGEIMLAGTLPTNLVVSLLSLDTTELIVPSSVTVLAGQTTARFDLTLVDDFVVDGNESVLITATAPGFEGGQNVLLVLDDDTPPGPANPRPADFATNVIANTTLSWSVTNATNDVYFGTNPLPGAAEFLGTTTGTNWTLPLLGPATTYYWQIISRRLGTNAGPVWWFTTRGLHHFAVGSVAATQYVGVPFPLAITAQDEFNTTVSNFNGTVTLSATGGAGELFRADFESGLGSVTLNNGVGHANGLWHLTSALGHAPGHSPTQSLYYGQNEGTNGNGNYNNGVANEGVVTLPALNLASAAPPVTMKFHHLVQTESGTNWDHTKVEISTNAGLSYQIIAARYFLTNGWSNDFGGQWRTQTVDLTPFSVNGALLRFHFDSIDHTGNNFIGWYIDDVVVSGTGTHLALTPPNAGPFNGGFWSNTVSVLAPGTNVIITIRDGQGHEGTSSALTVLAPPRLDIARAGLDVIVTWEAVPGRSYRVETKSALDDNWAGLAPDVLATGAFASFTNSFSAAQKFYRLLLLP
jgi:hypothetical protein